MPIPDAASGRDALPFDSTDWERRLEEARARRAEVLRRRMDTVRDAAQKPTRPESEQDELGPLADRLAEFEGDLAAGDHILEPVKEPKARPFWSMSVSPDQSGPASLAQRLDGLRGRVPREAVIAGGRAPGSHANSTEAPAARVLTPARPQARGSDPESATRRRHLRHRGVQLSTAFALGLIVGLPAAWLVPRLAAPVAEAVVERFSAFGSAPDEVAPIGGFPPPASVPDLESVHSGHREMVRAPRPVLPSPPVTTTTRVSALAAAPEPATGPAGAVTDEGDPPVATGPAAVALRNARLYVHVPSASRRAIAGIEDQLRAAGAGEWSSVRSPHTVSEDHVRFYHSEDRDAALAAGEAIGAEVRDFTSLRPSPESGLVEVWLSGAGTGGTVARPGGAAGQAASGFVRSLRTLIETFPANERQ